MPTSDPQQTKLVNLVDKIEDILTTGVSVLPAPGYKAPTPATLAPSFPTLSNPLTNAPSRPGFPTLAPPPPGPMGPKFPTFTPPPFPTLSNIQTSVGTQGPGLPTLNNLPTTKVYNPNNPPPMQGPPPPMTRNPPPKLPSFLRRLGAKVGRLAGPKQRAAFKGAMSNLRGAFGSNTPVGTGAAGSAVGGAVQAGGGLLAGAATKAAGPIGVMVKFGEAVIDGIQKLKKWSDQLHQANMQFAQFSGAMGMVAGKREAQEIMLGKERGDRLAKSAEALSDAQMGLNKATAPWEDAWQMVKSEFGTIMNKAVTGALEVTGITALGRMTADWLSGQRSKDVNEEDLNTWVNRLYEETNMNFQRTRPRSMQRGGPS